MNYPMGLRFRSVIPSITKTNGSYAAEQEVKKQLYSLKGQKPMEIYATEEGSGDTITFIATDKEQVNFMALHKALRVATIDHDAGKAEGVKQIAKDYLNMLTGMRFSKIKVSPDSKKDPSSQIWD